MHQIENNQRGGLKIRTITSRFWLFWKLFYVILAPRVMQIQNSSSWILACTGFTFNRSSKENIPGKTYLWKVYCTYIDIQKFNTKCLVMYKVQMHTGAISKIRVWFVRLYGR